MTDPAVRRQQVLLSILACPHCGNLLALDRATYVDEAIVDADLHCQRCGEVGALRTYRMSFLPQDLVDGWTPRGLAESEIDLELRAEVIGNWGPLSLGMLGMSVGSCLTGMSTAQGLTVELGTHDWGGAALISLADVERRVELNSIEVGFERVVLLRDDAGEPSDPSRWSIVVAPSAVAGEPGCQAIVKRITELVPANEAPPLGHHHRNLGNPYPERFEQVLAELPADAIVVDVGGGDRRHRDPRVLNFEYLKFGGADFFGDGLNLPIASDSVDLILSQAVLEHVSDPQRAVNELHRILRPGGRIYAEFAFIQPLHAVPFHFFNITPHGSALLFSNWNVIDSGTFGGLEVTLEWMFRLLGADSKIGTDATAAVLATLRKLDAALSPRDLEHVASAVFVEATRNIDELR